jgi:hypothetical protein
VLVIADDIRAALPTLRQHAESMMVTPCRIVRQGVPEFDEDTGAVTATDVTVFDGFCEIAANTNLVLDVDGVALAADLQRVIVKIPVAAGPVRIGDVVRADDRLFKVDGLHDRTWQKSQRLQVIEVV